VWRWAGAPSLAFLAGAGCPTARPPEPVLTAAPELRVGLAVGTGSFTLGGDAELLVTSVQRGELLGSIPAGAVWTVISDSAGLLLVRSDGTRTAVLRNVSAVAVTEGRYVNANGRRYRGRVTIFRDNQGLTAVNHVELDDYVAGVVGREIGARQSNERHAVLVQAVISRTYALANRGRWESLGFDAFADVRDQVYLGVGAETPQVWDAVHATRGEVVRYHGSIIEAFFHSTCGSSTAAVEDAFRFARPRPYLRAVSDAKRGGGHYCDPSPRFRWREEWDAAKLRTILTRTLPTVMTVGGDGLQPIVGAEVTRTTRTGRVAELRIAFERGDVRIPGSDIRRVLRPSVDRELLSTAFQLHVTSAGGRLTRLVANGAGAGHGVGLCQWGAIGRARAGQAYRDILTTYYPGTKVERVY
jgi:stage II sporulation protein D